MSEQQNVWEPPQEPLAIYTGNHTAASANPDNAHAFSIGARTIERGDGEILCPNEREVALWGMVAMQESGGHIAVRRNSEEYIAASRFMLAGLLVAEDSDGADTVTLRLHPEASINDLRQSDDPYDQVAIEFLKPRRSLEQIGAELREKGFVLTSAEELALPRPHGVDPATDVLERYKAYLKHYPGDGVEHRLRVTGLIAASGTEFVQSREPTVPRYKGDITEKRPTAYDYVDMLGSEVLRTLCEVNWQLLPEPYRSLPLNLSLNIFKVFRAIARTAHTDGGMQNVIWRLGHKSGLDGGWTYILEPKEGTEARDGWFKEAASFACRLIPGQILIIDDQRLGHTSKDNTGEDPSSETVVLATLPPAFVPA